MITIEGTIRKVTTRDGEDPLSSPGPVLLLMEPTGNPSKGELRDGEKESLEVLCPSGRLMLGFARKSGIVGEKALWAGRRDRSGVLVTDYLLAKPQRRFDPDLLETSLFMDISAGKRKSLLRAYGRSAFRAVYKNPYAVARKIGIEPEEARTISERLKKFGETADIYYFLRDCGISAHEAVALTEELGKNTIRFLLRNPYIAVDISGKWNVGDKISDAFSVADDHESRVIRAVKHVMRQIEARGHTAVPLNSLRNMLSRRLGYTTAMVEKGIEHLEHSGDLFRIVSNTGMAYVEPAKYRQMAENIAYHLSRLEHYKEDPAGVVIEEEEGRHLTDKQRLAVEVSQQSRCLVISGPAGSGKTTVLKAIVAGLRASKSAKTSEFALVAFTARAASRMAEEVGIPGQTIHSLIGLGPNGEHLGGSSAKLAQKYFIIDEASMIPMDLFSKLMDAMPSDARMVMVGDPNQLPSVSPGRVLNDMIEADEIPTVRLDTVHRQSGDSGILKNALRLLERKMPQKNDDFVMIAAKDQNETLEKLKKVMARLGKDGNPGPDSVQLLTPFNKSKIGVENLNRIFAPLFNKRGGKPAFSVFGEEFRIGDRIMIRRNDKASGLSNGDVGELSRVRGKGENIDVTINVRGEEYHLNHKQIRHIQRAFAITVHKSQGSEYPWTILVLDEKMENMKLNHLYTAITRAREKMVIVGPPEAIRNLVEKAGYVERYSALKIAIERHVGAGFYRNVTKLEGKNLPDRKGNVIPFDPYKKAV